MKNILLLALSIILIAPAAHAFPVFQLKNAKFTDAQTHTFTSAYDFTGIVGLSNCSGSLVRFEQSNDADLAMVLSNGHCMGKFPAPGTIVHNKPDNRRFSVLDATGKRLGSIRATEIIYGTMTKTDMALFRLDKTYGEILSQFGIPALTLSSRKAQVGDEIEIISGYWRRGYSCQIEKFVHKLREGSWTMEDSIRYSRPGCQVIGGTSGSPITLAGTRTVIGVNNTGSENGLECKINNPCEIDEDGNVSSHKGYSYGQQTYWVYSCLNDQLELDLNKAGCQLHR